VPASGWKAARGQGDNPHRFGSVRLPRSGRSSRQDGAQVGGYLVNAVAARRSVPSPPPRCPRIRSWCRGAESWRGLGTCRPSAGPGRGRAAEVASGRKGVLIRTFFAREQNRKLLEEMAELGVLAPYPSGRTPGSRVPVPRGNANRLSGELNPDKERGGSPRAGLGRISPAGAARHPWWGRQRGGKQARKGRRPRGAYRGRRRISRNDPQRKDFLKTSSRNTPPVVSSNRRQNQ